MRPITGTVTFTAEGVSLPAFRAALREAGIRCRNQQMQGGVLHGEIRRCDRAPLETAAAAHGVTLRITRETGLLRRLRPYRLRIGIPLGLLLGCGFLWWSNAYIRSIVITGNSRLSDTEILAALESLGITCGTPLRDISFTYAEQRMRIAVRDIERISMRHTGGRLTVEIAEELSPPQLSHPHAASNYIAAVPAQITDISVLGGHAVCKVGDAVKPGDLLISGVDTDKFGITHYYRGDGVITGIYEAEFTQEQPFCTELPVRGETETASYLLAFGKRIPLTWDFQEPAYTFIYEEDRATLSVFGHPLPLSVLRCHYTEQLTGITVFSEAEAKAVLEEAARRFEQNFHAEDRILGRNVSFQQTDLGISLKINYVFEGVIGKISEIFVKLS